MTETHLLPAAVAAALATERPELLKLGADIKLSPEEVRGVYSLLGELITERRRQRLKIEQLTEVLDRTKTEVRSAYVTLQSALTNLTARLNEEELYP